MSPALTTICQELEAKVRVLVSQPVSPSLGEVLTPMQPMVQFCS